MNKINEYIETVFHTEDSLLKEVKQSIAENGMPSISVSSSSGKLLTMLVSIAQAENVLEIGALGGYSGICLARGFGGSGRLTSLELEDSYAQLAHSNLAKAGFGERVSYLTGTALENLEKLIAEDKKFDFFFIDADKDNYENYMEACLKLATPGALIVADNVLARGSVADETIESKHKDIMKKFNQTVAAHPQLESLLIPVGDGMTVSKVKK